MWINAKGQKFWVKYHFHTSQGMAFFNNAEAADVAGSDADFHRRDPFEAAATSAAWRSRSSKIGPLSSATPLSTFT
jgi:catalase